MTIHPYNNNQVLYSVGPDKDAYNIFSHYTHNVETDEITHHHSLVKNWMYDELPKGQQPKEGKKYKEIIFNGTLKECYEQANIIAEQNGKEHISI